MRLQNKVAIITGAGTGIGEAIAHRFAREGARLALSGLPTDPVQYVAEAIANTGGHAVTHLSDLAEELHAQACVELALRTFGLLDILISNAGIFIANAAIEDYRIEDFDRTIRNNIRTAFLMTKFALPHLRASRGNIIFSGSEAGLNGSPKFTPYGGSKGFLHAFMKGVALEQAPYGVRANCVCRVRSIPRGPAAPTVRSDKPSNWASTPWFRSAAAEHRKRSPTPSRFWRLMRPAT
jgi:NAD(P)-dependent dehydrogenase (short-subunit alcohol dehydrogenase family)